MFIYFFLMDLVQSSFYMHHFFFFPVIVCLLNLISRTGTGFFIIDTSFMPLKNHVSWIIGTSFAFMISIFLLPRNALLFFNDIDYMIKMLIQY